MGAKENAVMKSCKDALAVAGVFFWRQNSGLAMLPGRGGRPQPVRFGVVGAGDYGGILPGGYYIEVECKTGNGKQTDNQKQRQVDLERAGACYVLARGYDDVTEGISDFLRRVK